MDGLLPEQLNFNPRSPHGERPHGGSHANQPRIISIHAPRTGSDTASNPQRSGENISIHAPRTGSDATLARKILQDVDFNPRSPHGERHRPVRLLVVVDDISIHAPRTGSDSISVTDGAGAEIFQSTLPARGATARDAVARLDDDISIHAPRTGSDASLSARNYAPRDFNPRSPHGERP